jgi:hypothetical protein
LVLAPAVAVLSVPSTAHDDERDHDHDDERVDELVYVLVYD